MARPGAKSSKKARSFSGCKCCKQAKRKCPEERPRCSICEKLGLKCEVPSILSVFQLILTWSSMISTFYSDVKWSISKAIFQKPKGSLDLVSLNPPLCIGICYWLISSTSKVGFISSWGYTSWRSSLPTKIHSLRIHRRVCFVNDVSYHISWSISYTYSRSNRFSAPCILSTPCILTSSWSRQCRFT